MSFVASRLAALPVANWSLSRVHVFRPENFWVQVWAAREAGRTASAASAASRATEVRVWSCMRREGGSFIRSDRVSPSVCLVCIKEPSRGRHVGG